jgi:N-methylhydantoinase A
MRYRGQGHDLTVEIPAAPFGDQAAAVLEKLFVAAYEQQFGRRIPDLEVEVLSFALRLATTGEPIIPCPPVSPGDHARPSDTVEVVDPETATTETVPLYVRDQLAVGAICEGPALIVEDETTTMVTRGFTAHIDSLGSIVMTRT